MSKRIKVGFYVHEWTLGGTARSHLRILEALDRNLFEPFALVWDKGKNDLILHLDQILGDHVIPFRRSLEKTGPDGAYTPISTDFDSVVASLDLDILHHARGGYPEWPLSTHHLAPLQVETNIFGDLDKSENLDKSMAICQYIRYRRGAADAVIYNPIPAAEPGGNLREKLGIKPDAVVCGRIGRPANFDPIALEAFIRVQKDHPNMFYLVVAPCLEFNTMTFERKAPNVICFPPTTDDAWINSFYRTMDIFLHYRADGECHSTAIAQAMMYGVPVLSHTSPIFNGQFETIQEGGAVWSTVDEYATQLRIWVEQGNEIRKPRGELAKDWATKNYLQSTVVRQIEDKYLEWAK